MLGGGAGVKAACNAAACGAAICPCCHARVQTLEQDLQGTQQWQPCLEGVQMLPSVVLLSAPCASQGCIGTLEQDLHDFLSNLAWWTTQAQQTHWHISFASSPPTCSSCHHLSHTCAASSAHSPPPPLKMRSALHTLLLIGFCSLGLKLSQSLFF